MNNTSQEESSRVRNNGGANGKNGKSVHFSQRLTNPQTKKITDTQRPELLQQQGQQSQESQSHPHESHNTRFIPTYDADTKSFEHPHSIVCGILLCMC